VDVAAERDRLKKDLERIEKEVGNGERQLSNQQFIAKAPPAVIEGIRTKVQELTILREKTASKLAELG
jgi:valyl-tRNA synthetase